MNLLNLIDFDFLSFNYSVIVTIDDVGTKFYIILDGKVGVHIRMPVVKSQGPNESSNNTTT